VPITTAATPRPPDPHARNTAFGGAAICLVGLLTVLTIGAAKSGLRRPRDSVPGD
jgi:membrane-anchored mycosin MYCP